MELLVFKRKMRRSDSEVDKNDEEDRDNSVENVPRKPIINTIQKECANEDCFLSW
jgi:hypothetical protein